MSESAEERSKRTFCKYLDLARWKYQYSFFHNDQQAARVFAIRDGAALRKALARKFKSQPFLYRLCLTDRGYKEEIESVDEFTGEITIIKEKPTLLPYHMFFTTKKLPYDVVSNIGEKSCLGGEIKLLYRHRSDWQILRYKSAVRIQKPHNLKRFFGDGKINRIALLNRVALRPAPL